MATNNILYIKHEQFLKIMEERIQNEGMDSNIQRIMHDYLCQKRKITWTINLEKIFILYVKVCVAVDETDCIEEALKQYKFFTQATYSSSLESVLVQIRSSLETLFNSKIQQFNIEDVKACGDIESEEIEHDLLVSYLSINQKKKEIQIKKVLRQIMENYKYIIENSKFHKRLEEVYTTTVEKVLEFCLKYNRTREFKRFLENQHNFLEQILKRDVDFNKNPNHINIFTSDTRDYMIKVRLDCANYALQMGFYSHAFTQLEDISILLNLRKVIAPIKLHMLSQYYFYLSKIFWNSKYYCYHTYFLYNHYFIHKNLPSTTEEEKQKLTNQILLSVLSIPSNSLENSQNEDSRMKIAQLQKGTSKLIPRREEIINMVLRMNLNEFANEQINTLFNVTINEINIFNISKKVEPIFAYLRESSYLEYIKPIEENLINRVLNSISKVYKTLNIENLYKFLSFSATATCDSCLINASSSSQINCRIDQSKRVIIFNPTKAKNDYVNASSNIINLAQAAKLISSNIVLEQQAHDTKKQAELNQNAKKYMESSTQVLSVRNKEIREYKIKTEKSLNQEKVKREYEDQLYEENERQRKINEYNQKIEQKKLREQHEQNELKIKMQLRAEIIKIKGPQIAKIEGIKIENMTEEDLRPISLQTLQELQKDVQDKIKDNQENKYKKAFTKADYIERETRKLEADKIKKIIEKGEKDENLEQHVTNARAKFEEDLKQKSTLEAARQFKEKFFQSIMQQRKVEYESQIQQFKTQIEKEFKKKILENAKVAYIEDKQKKEEEERKQQEEKEKLQKEQQEKSEKTSSNAGWRIVEKEKDLLPPSFDDAPKLSEKPKDDQWRMVEITRPEKKETSNTITRGPGTSTLTKTEDKGISRNTAPVQTEKEDNAWRTTKVQATTKPAEQTSAPFKFTSNKTNAPSQNNQSSGNPNDGFMKRGIGSSTGSTFPGNKPSYSKPVQSGNPNASNQSGGMQRNMNSNINKDNKNNDKKESSNTTSWRK
ncbi:hypothetical protein ABPG74_018581 [Tetrahymena malaccensis]